MRKLWTGVPLAVQNLKARIARNFYQAGNRALGDKNNSEREVEDYPPLARNLGSGSKATA